MKYIFGIYLLMLGIGCECLHNERGECRGDNLMRCADEYQGCQYRNEGNCRQKAMECRGEFSSNTRDLAILFQSRELQEIAQADDSGSNAVAAGIAGGMIGGMMAGGRR